MQKSWPVNGCLVESGYNCLTGGKGCGRLLFSWLDQNAQAAFGKTRTAQRFNLRYTGEACFNSYATLPQALAEITDAGFIEVDRDKIRFDRPCLNLAQARCYIWLDPDRRTDSHRDTRTARSNGGQRGGLILSVQRLPPIGRAWMNMQRPRAHGYNSLGISRQFFCAHRQQGMLSRFARSIQTGFN